MQDVIIATFLDKPVPDPKVISVGFGSCRQVENTTPTLSVPIPKTPTTFIGDGKVRKIERVSNQPQGDHPKTIEISTSFEKHKLKSNPVAAFSLHVAGVVPPLGLRVVMCVQITRQFDRLMLGSIAQSRSLANNHIGDSIKYLRSKAFDRLKKFAVLHSKKSIPFL
jgi:hypothetical protein